MININLTPKSELENPLWFVPDALLLALVCVIGMFGVDLYLDTERQQIDVLVAEQSELQRESAKFAPFVEQLKRLDGQLSDVNKRLTALNGVSGELVEKYAPVIGIEHVQNLKPRGIWLEKLTIDNKSKPAGGGGGRGRQAPKQASGSSTGSGKVSLSGFALDNLLVAEFMASLRATKTQSIEASDLRTQVFFEGIELQSTNLGQMPADVILVRGATAVGARGGAQPEVIRFNLTFSYNSNPVKGALTVSSFQDFYPVNPTFDLAQR